MFAQYNSDFYYDTPNASTNQQVATEDLWTIVADGVVTENDSLLNSFLRMFGFGAGDYENNTLKALVYIKAIINLLLGLVSFVALVIIIYSFYGMFFTEDSKGMEKVKKNLIGVVIALVVLGLSWIIVSFLFDFYQTKLVSGVI